MADLSKILVRDAGFSSRVRNVLRAQYGDDLRAWQGDDLTLADLFLYEDAELLKLPRFGSGCLREVRDVIRIASKTRGMEAAMEAIAAYHEQRQRAPGRPDYDALERELAQVASAWAAGQIFSPELWGRFSERVRGLVEHGRRRERHPEYAR